MIGYNVELKLIYKLININIDISLTFVIKFLIK